MNDGQRFTFKKKERVTGEKRVEALFTHGASFMAYPFRVVFRATPRAAADDVSLSVLVSVPKKRLKSAVKRNRVKRLAREAFRLNKHFFHNGGFPENRHLDVAFIYVKNEPADYPEVEKAMRKALNVLLQRVTEEESAEC